ncbi:tyrosine-type recombinase/integrase [Pseudomonadales bacterium]|jgi:integrase|nr:tyrosine-type recombinase/integrase [Pseudomonadales bacterium]
MVAITSSTSLELKPTLKRRDITCEIRKGFTLRQHPTGSISYKYRFREGGKSKEILLHHDYELALAQYQEIRASRERQVDLRRDQVSGKHIDALFLLGDFEYLQGQWMRRHVRKNLTRSTEVNYQHFVDQTRSKIGKQLKATIAVPEARRLIRGMLNEVAHETPTQSNRFRTALSGMFKYGLEHDLVSRTPIYGLPKQKESPKSRMFNDDELRLLLPYLNQCDISRDKVDALKLLLMTAMRSGEVLRIEHEHLDLANGTLSLPVTKNGQPFLVALPQLAVELLQQRQSIRVGHKKLFDSTTCGLRQACQRAAKNVGITQCSPHDYRRTAATMAGRLGVDLDTIGRLLNHSAVGVTRRHYALYDKASEKRAALELITARLVQLGMRI